MPAQGKQKLMKVLAFKVSAVWKGSREDMGNIFWRPEKVPCIARRSNQSILKEISPGCSLEGLILKLKLQYFGHLVRRADSFEKTLMLERLRAGGEGDNRGWDGRMASPTQWTWVWVDSRSWWWTGRPGMLQSMGSQSWTQLSDWTKLNWKCNKCWRYRYRCRYNSCGSGIFLKKQVWLFWAHPQRTEVIAWGQGEARLPTPIRVFLAFKSQQRGCFLSHPVWAELDQKGSNVLRLPLVSLPFLTTDSPWLPQSRHHGPLPQLSLGNWELHTKF